MSTAPLNITLTSISSDATVDLNDPAFASSVPNSGSSNSPIFLKFINRRSKNHRSENERSGNHRSENERSGNHRSENHWSKMNDQEIIDRKMNDQKSLIGKSLIENERSGNRWSENHRSENGRSKFILTLHIIPSTLTCNQLAHLHHYHGRPSSFTRSFLVGLHHLEPISADSVALKFFQHSTAIQIGFIYTRRIAVTLPVY